MKSQTVSKSQFKAKALEYMRFVEKHNAVIIVTDMGHPVVNIVPHQEKTLGDRLAYFKDTLIKYENPLEPIGVEDWEALK